MYNTRKVENFELPELVGQIIDAFEAFLEDRGIDIVNDEKNDAILSGDDASEVSILYGTDYGELQDAIEGILIDWSLAEPWQ